MRMNRMRAGNNTALKASPVHRRLDDWHRHRNTFITLLRLGNESARACEERMALE